MKLHFFYLFFFITLFFLNCGVVAQDTTPIIQEKSTFSIQLNCNDSSIQAFNKIRITNPDEICQTFKDDLKNEKRVVVVYEGKFKGSVFDKHAGYYYLADEKNQKTSNIINFEIGNFGFVTQDHYDSLNNSKEYKLSQIQIEVHDTDMTEYESVKKIMIILN